MAAKKLKACMMAAGKGTRLEPLTLAVPKPMVPIVNKPVMQYGLELLADHGFTDVAVNLHTFPEQIENYFGDGSRAGVSIQYSFEDELLGTAGGVRRMAIDILQVGEPFVIVSGDALTDIDLTALVAAHNKAGALMSIALRPVEDSREYGVVICDDSRRVTAFQEKPLPQEALSHLVNTGIYIVDPAVLKMIPADSVYDFGRQLFPLLVQKKAPLFGFEVSGYWSDVGSLRQYTQANKDMMAAQIKATLDGEWRNGALIHPTAHIDAQAQIQPGAAVGAHARVHAGAVVGRGAIIGNSAVIRARAHILGSVIWPETVVGENAVVQDAIVGAFCYIEDNAAIDPDVVVGNRSHVKKGTHIPQGHRIPPDEIVQSAFSSRRR